MISVLIPVGPDEDADRYLDECLASIDDPTAEVIVRRNEIRTMPARLRNRMAREATGDWVQFLDQDDWLVAGSLQHRLELGERLGADAVYGEVAHTNGRPAASLKEGLYTGVGVQTNAWLVRREVALSIPWREDEPRNDDGFWTRDLYLGGAKIAHLPEVVAWHRCSWSPNQLTASRDDLWHQTVDAAALDVDVDFADWRIEILES